MRSQHIVQATLRAPFRPISLVSGLRGVAPSALYDQGKNAPKRGNTRG